jgi:DtxR family Mn-dependent transcriptional regulator
MSDSVEMSESVEMYLLRVAMLRKGTRPVPLSLLAQELAISPVSANEMCHRLMGEGWLTYEPYKGVTLTTQGETIAQRILRRRRLWEVFLVEKLSMEPHAAEDISCRMEHVTPDEVADRLAAFLGNPTRSPQNQPIPAGNSIPVDRPTFALTLLPVGEPGQVVGINGDMVTREFLYAQGITPDAVVVVLAVTAEGVLLLEVAGNHLSLARPLAEQVVVVPARDGTPGDADGAA